jgi:hypothetical protein
VEGLLGADFEFSGDLVPAGEQTRYTNNVGQLNLTKPEVMAFAAAGKRVQAHVVKDIGRLLPCLARGGGDGDCVEPFLGAMTDRFYRGLGDAAARGRTVALYRKLIGEGGLAREEAVGAAISFLAQAPLFLFRPEGGTAPQKGLASLRPEEIASQLSFLLWNQPPPPELMGVAATLADRAKLGNEARRMMKDPRFFASLAMFLGQWSGFDNLRFVDKDKDFFPFFTDKVRADMCRDAGKSAAFRA